MNRWTIPEDVVLLSARCQGRSYEDCKGLFSVLSLTARTVKAFQDRLDTLKNDHHQIWNEAARTFDQTEVGRLFLRWVELKYIKLDQVHELTMLDDK